MRPILRSISVPLVIALAMAGAMPVFGQSMQLRLEQSINAVGRHTLTNLSALAVSPTSDRFAVADENLGRAFILQTDGQLAWIAGETGYLRFPTAVMFEDDATILVVTKDLLVLRVNETSPDLCDTVANLAETTKRSEIRAVSQLMTYGDGYLVLDPDNGQVVRLDAEWKADKVFISHGRAKGKVWSPSALARDISGKLFIADRGDYPMQAFSKSGSILFSADWNAPERQRTWEAGSVAITRQETILCADLTNRAWRLYDQTGSFIDQILFAPPGLTPLGASVTIDNRLVVIEKKGTISIWSLEL